MICDWLTRIGIRQKAHPNHPGGRMVLHFLTANVAAFHYFSKCGNRGVSIWPRESPDLAVSPPLRQKYPTVGATSKPIG